MQLPRGPVHRSPIIFSNFFVVFGPWDWFQSLLQALKFNIPPKMCDLDAYLSSYVTFRRVRRFWSVANPLLHIWESLFMILRPGKGSCLHWKGFFVFDLLSFQAVIKLAASAGSRSKSRNPEEPASDGAAGGRRKRRGSPGSLDFGLRGGCASSPLDQGSKVLYWKT